MLLLLKKYYPIDRDSLKKRWDEIVNIPNNEWEKRNIDESINIINNTEFPHTLRTFKLNMLPALIINILDEKK